MDPLIVSVDYTDYKCDDLPANAMIGGDFNRNRERQRVKGGELICCWIQPLLAIQNNLFDKLQFP